MSQSQDFTKIGFAKTFVLPALLIAAAGWDLTTYTIPNFLQLGLIASFAVFVVAIGMTPAMFGEHLLAGFIGFVIGVIFFALGYIGGGDAKLFACIALWLGFQDFLDYALTASILGGALTLGTYCKPTSSAILPTDIASMAPTASARNSLVVSFFQCFFAWGRITSAAPSITTE